MHTGFTILGQPTSWLELCATATGMAGVWLTIRKDIRCFPVGMVSVALYVLIFIQPGIRLYADALLQIFFFVLLSYGWITWKKSASTSEGPPESTRPEEWKSIIPVTLAMAFAGGWAFKTYTDASLPWLDAALTAVSLTAQWMIAKRKTANWWLWILVDTVYVPLYLYKGLVLTAVLYFVFLIMAIAGLAEWKKQSRLNNI